MPRRAVLLLDMDNAMLWRRLLLLATLVAIASGFPATNEDDDSSGPLPFLQFTKGGIRVNFGGYHAQAGLGGLLTGSKADGGLHASAGTPNGAHASANLGGSLDDGPVGGLHARAGLGNGGPEAEAGLGGTLAGPRPRGELYAGSSPGEFIAIDKINRIERPEKSYRKTIELVSRSKKASDQPGVVAIADSATTKEQTVTNDKEPSSSSSSSSSSATTNAGSSSNDGDEESSAERSQYPARWYFRKRLRERAGPYYVSESPTSPSASHNANTSTPDPANPTSSSDSRREGPPAKQPRPKFGGIFARATADANADSSGSANGQKYKSSTFFDDIFNIPISALNAVNQLLKNHVGKK